MSSIRRPEYQQAALENHAAPEQLDQLITLVPIQSWVWLAAVASLLIASILWGFFGTLTFTVEQACVLTMRAQVSEAVTYVPMSKAQAIQLGMPARVVPFGGSQTIDGQVTRIAVSEATPDQAAAVVGRNGFDDSPIFEVHVALATPSVAEDKPCTVTITTGEARPISRVLPIQ